MINSFIRNDITNQPDLGEKVGNFCLGLLRISFGKTLTVHNLKSHEVESKTDNQVVFKNTERTLFIIQKIETVAKKIFTGALFFLGLPVTLILAGIGLVSKACSKSFHTYLQKYLNFIPKTLEQEDRPVKITTEDIATHGLASLLDARGVFVEQGESKEIIKRLPIARLENLTIPGVLNNFIGGNWGCMTIKNGAWDLQIRYTENNRAIIQQQTISSCAPTCVAMLAKDNGGSPIWGTLQLHNDECGLRWGQIKELLQASVPDKEVIVGTFETLPNLKEAIEKNGSAICSIGEHSIVVDNINELDEVTIRDPQNGCESTVRGEAFIKERNKGLNSAKFKIIQIKNDK